MAFEPPWRCPPRLESTQDLICVRAAQPRSLRGWRAWKQIVKRMVLSTIHVSQAHILEKQSRRRTADSTVRPYGWIQESTVRLFLYRFAATSGRKLIDDLCEQLDEARSNLRGVRSDAAVWRVLPNLIAQPIINTRYLQQVVGLSKPQAERAIKTLSECGVVVARTGKQRSVVYEHRGILDVLDDYAAGLRRG